MTHSEKLQALLHSNPNLCDASDSSCTTGYDNDGSTGFEIFINGTELANAAHGRPIFYAQAFGGTYFFIANTENELLTKLENAPRVPGGVTDADEKIPSYL